MTRSFCIISMAFAFLLTSISQTKNPYLHEGSVGKKMSAVRKKQSKGPFAYRDVPEWVGERFIFLPQRASSSDRRDAYLGIESGPAFTASPAYELYVGRIMKVVSVEEQGSKFLVTFKMEDADEIVRGTVESFFRCILHIAPIADIDAARTKWLGKTLWYKEKQLTFYDEVKDETGTIDIRKCSPVKVIDVVASWDSDCPVRFVLRGPKGNEGYEDLNVSNTNVLELHWKWSRFEDVFFEKNPRLIYDWPPRVWHAIETGKVFIGMSKQQAILSWGHPREINRTKSETSQHEQWVFGSGNYLYFDGDRITSIQN